MNGDGVGSLRFFLMEGDWTRDWTNVRV